MIEPGTGNSQALGLDGFRPPSVALLGLATGGSLLLLAAIYAYPFVFPSGISSLILWVTLTVTAVSILGVAWIALVLSVLRPLNPRSPRPPISRDTRAACYLSFVVLVASLVSVPFQLNAVSSNIIFFLGPFSLLLVPYLPLVFGPVVLSQAYVLLRYDKTGFEIRGRWLRSLGILSLAGIALVGVVGQVVFYLVAGGQATWSFWLFAPLPAGLTAIGYWILYFAFRVARPSVGSSTRN